MIYRALNSSRISCLRIGILSMERVSSRTSQGKGLRSFTPPSLPISASMNPRGRSFWRSSDFASGFVSTMSTTSRSARSSRRALSRSICSTNRGSFGVSAKTTMGRAIHLKSSNVTSSVAKTTARSARHSSSGAKIVSACAAVKDEKSAMSATVKMCFIPDNIISKLPMDRPGGVR